ncbi:VOC family metalloprotein YjdN [Escherichia coli]
MPLTYLFAGNCADAIAYYQRTLGAELLYKISFGEMPKSAQDSAEEAAHLRNAISRYRHRPRQCAHCRKRYHDERCYTVRKSQLLRLYAGAGFTTSKEGKRWFDNLAANGKIEMAWQETFWAHGFGKVTDKFGVPWMINVVKQQPTQ